MAPPRKPKVPETTAAPRRKPSSLDDLRKRREVDATAPSGEVFRLRPINLERHALSGGLPAKLRQVAMGGTAAIDKLLGVDTDDDGEVIERPETDDDRGAKTEILAYLDGLVRSIVVEPELPAPGEGDIDEVLLPADYKWLVAVAMGETDSDGEGRRLWGREPLSRFQTFREFHGCEAGCEGCEGVRSFFSAALIGSMGAIPG